VADNIERNNSPISVTKLYQMKWAFIKVNFKVSATDMAETAGKM